VRLVGRRLLKGEVSVNRAKDRVKAKRYGTKLGRVRFTTEGTEDAEFPDRVLPAIH
jgi:hypothetical protein